MRRTAILASIAIFALCATADPAEAQRRRANVSTEKTFGLGVMLGAPSGLSGKLYLGESTMALAFGLGADSYGPYYGPYYRYHGMHAHIDVVWHPAVLADARAFSLPFYVGVGGWTARHGYYDDRGRYYYEGNHAGLRVPLGISFDFRRAPLDLFLEMVPSFEMTRSDYYRRSAYITGAVGLRYYF